MAALIDLLMEYTNVWDGPYTSVQWDVQSPVRPRSPQQTWTCRLGECRSPELRFPLASTPNVWVQPATGRDPSIYKERLELHAMPNPLFVSYTSEEFLEAPGDQMTPKPSAASRTAVRLFPCLSCPEDLAIPGRWYCPTNPSIKNEAA